MIERVRHLQSLDDLMRRFPVVAILGARQVGKTTLAKDLIQRYADPVHFLDLENPADEARLQDPLLGLKNLRGYVVLDEIQRRPDIFPVLRVLADRDDIPARFLILGSASPDLLRQSSESLAGRVALYELSGFTMDEVGAERVDQLWLRGGFPRSFLSESDAASSDWRRSFVQTYLERDLPQLGITTSSLTLRRFWTMLAHIHGHTWNASEFGRSFGVSDTTVRRYLDILTSTFVARQLLPWHENLGKRQIKSPKIYLTDTGLLHALLNLRNLDELEGHPKVGSSWEGFAINEVLARLNANHEECFFWATHAGAEIDLLVVRGDVRLGFEFKRSLSPKLTPSMRTALKDLSLDRIRVVYPGEDSWPISDRIDTLPIKGIWTELSPL